MRIPEGKRRIFQISPTQAKVLVCALGVLVAVVDFAAPGDINIAIFYCLAIVLTVWTRSLVWLWGSTLVFLLLTFGGFRFAPPPIQTHPSWIHWTNRGMTASALILVATPFFRLDSACLQFLSVPSPPRSSYTQL